MKTSHLYVLFYHRAKPPSKWPEWGIWPFPGVMNDRQHRSVILVAQNAEAGGSQVQIQPGKLSEKVF